MRAMCMLVCSAGLIAGFSSAARADDVSDYKQKMHDCVTQMKADHPDQNYEKRRKACHQQLGPSPHAKAGTPPETSAPPGTPPATPPSPPTANP